jgi:hypothetical protein
LLVELDVAHLLLPFFPHAVRHPGGLSRAT